MKTHLFSYSVPLPVPGQVYLHRNRVSMCIDLTRPLFCALQVARVGGQEDGGHEGCVPGFQVKHYQVAYSGAFQKGQALLQGQ